MSTVSQPAAWQMFAVKQFTTEKGVRWKCREIQYRKWSTIKIVYRDDKIEGWLNEKKLLAATDMTFIEAGGVGVWTKADAATSFDDVSIWLEAKKWDGLSRYYFVRHRKILVALLEKKVLIQ